MTTTNMKNYAILSKKTYIDENGKEKISWYRAGHIKELATGARYLVLYHQPDTEFKIVESEGNTK